MNPTTSRGYLYVPASGPDDAVLAYAIEHATLSIPGAQHAGGATGDRHALSERAIMVRGVAAGAPAAGLYRLRIRIAAGVWLGVVRGSRAGSPLDEIRKLQATARRRPDGKRLNPKALRTARQARALADALRRFVLPVYTGEIEAVAS